MDRFDALRRRNVLLGRYGACEAAMDAARDAGGFVTRDPRDWDTWEVWCAPCDAPDMLA